MTAGSSRIMIDVLVWRFKTAASFWSVPVGVWAYGSRGLHVCMWVCMGDAGSKSRTKVFESGHKLRPLSPYSGS